MKNTRVRILIGALVVALVAMSCDLPFGLGNILGGNPTAAPTAEPTKESGVTGDISTVILKESDFPEGFVQLTNDELESMGLTAESMATSFEGTFSEATAENFVAFMNSDVNSFEIAMAMVFYPVNRVEQASFDLELADPDAAAENFASGLGSESEVLVGSDKYGNSSIGFTFVDTSSDTNMRGDMVVARRGDAVILTMVMYMDGTTPPMNILTMTGILDQRLAAAQK